jgi:AcrR family transcriptional regulator
MTSLDEQKNKLRLSPQQVKSRMLGAGLRQVQEHGLTVGFDHFQMDALIRRADVSRASVYRLWPTRDAYLTDLLEEIARDSGDHLVDQSTFDVAIGVVVEHQDLLASPAGRRSLMREVIRVAIEHNYYAVIDSLAWQSLVTLSAALLGEVPSAVRDRFNRTLGVSGDSFITALADVHRWFSRLLGFRMRAEFGDNYRLYAVLCCAVVEGLGIRHMSNPLVTDSFFRGPETLESLGRPEWAPASLGTLALFDEFMEEAPVYDLRSALDELHQVASSQR